MQRWERPNPSLGFLRVTSIQQSLSMIEVIAMEWRTVGIVNVTLPGPHAASEGDSRLCILPASG